MTHEIKPTANFGDLVTVVGYGNRVFIVEAFTIEHHHEAIGVSVDIVYDLTCPFTFEYVLGEQTDISVTCRAPQAESYLAQAEPYVANAPPQTIRLQVITKADVKGTRKSKRTKQAEIDALLDEMITMQTVIDICGSDDGYAVRIADVKRKLKEATA